MFYPVLQTNNLKKILFYKKYTNAKNVCNLSQKLFRYVTNSVQGN